MDWDTGGEVVFRLQALLLTLVSGALSVFAAARRGHSS